MNKKLYSLLLLTISFMTIFTTLPVQNANAKSIPGFNSSYWYKSHKMRVRKATVAYRVKPSSYAHANKKVRLAKNTHITVYNSANLSWVVKSRKLPKKHGYTWVVKKYNTSWLKY